MSLRARLTAGLLALCTAALVTLGGVTYFETRSFQLERVDQQARAAFPAVGRALDERGVPGGRPQGRGDFGPPGHSPDEGDRIPPGAINLPPGTYGQRRDATGRVLGHVTLTYDQAAPPPPRLPADVPMDRVLTVPAAGGSDLRYRVASSTEPGGIQTIVAVPLREVDQTLHRLLVVEALVIGGVLLALGALAWLVARIGLRPLDRMADTAGAIVAGDLSQRVEPATTRTEVGRLGLALNRMLERLEEAFAKRARSEDRLRRFIADASHELRTPLASIRGYAEVLRMGAARTPEETGRATRRIEDEAARMGVLVEDLLTLARLDEVRDSVREDVDMTSLVRDAVDDARATAPDRAIGLEANGPAIVAGDRDQLRQVLGNLLRNALVHTPSGSPIDVAIGRRDRDVELVVTDHGPGLPTEDPETLFERFWRAEGGRERGRGGAGLGLAIVAGIADAHGGRVWAKDAPGGGARFVLRLPAQPSG